MLLFIKRQDKQHDVLRSIILRKISRLKETDEGYEFMHAIKELNFNRIWNQPIFRRVLSGGKLSVTFYMLCLSDLLAGALIPAVRNPEDINEFLRFI